MVWCPMTIMHSILAINSGSSSLRFALFKVGESLPPILIVKFDRIGFPDAKLSVTDFPVKKSGERRIDVSNHVACVPPLVELLEKKTGVDSVSTINRRCWCCRASPCQPWIGAGTRPPLAVSAAVTSDEGFIEPLLVC